jgi:hypothetical protein
MYRCIGLKTRLKDDPQYHQRRFKNWAQMNKEQRREYHRQWRKDNPERMNEYMRKYNREWRQKYSARFREAANAQARRRYEENRTKLLEILGKQCIVCADRDIRHLQLDHINGGGAKHVNSFSNFRNMVAYYATHADEARQIFQILCANHNAEKKYTKGEMFLSNALRL